MDAGGGAGRIPELSEQPGAPMPGTMALKANRQSDKPVRLFAQVVHAEGNRGWLKAA
jgi:hypothetical protein